MMDIGLLKRRSLLLKRLRKVNNICFVYNDEYWEKHKRRTRIKNKIKEEILSISSKIEQAEGFDFGHSYFFDNAMQNMDEGLGKLFN